MNNLPEDLPPMPEAKAQLEFKFFYGDRDIGPSELLKSHTEFRRALINFRPEVKRSNSDHRTIFLLVLGETEIAFPLGTKKDDAEYFANRIHQEISILINPWLTASRQESVKLVNQI